MNRKQAPWSCDTANVFVWTSEMMDILSMTTRRQLKTTGSPWRVNLVAMGAMLVGGLRGL